MSEADGHLSVATRDIVEWTQAFVRYPSPQTERFEQEPQVQSFIAEQVVPLVQALGLPWRRDSMGNLLVELGPERADRSLMLMAYAMTHPANRMTLDAGFFCFKGAESGMWGPGDIEQWHSEDERIAVSDLVAGAVSYVGMIEEYLCQ